MMRILQRIKRELKYKYIEAPKYNNAIVHKYPWFILGNPKSGTTAIAKLLSMASGKTLTADFSRAIPHYTLPLELRYKLLSFKDFIEKYKYEFSNELIKEPMLTFFVKELFTHFPDAKYIFIIRDPYQNIRSILNRLKIPGNLQDIDLFEWEELKITPAWKLALQSEMIGFHSQNYIEAMAHRWNVAASSYLENQDKFILVKYEDFKQDKENYIYQLCGKMGLDIVSNISDQVNVQFQPKGNSKVKIEEFFGDANYKIIESICGENIKKFGY